MSGWDAFPTVTAQPAASGWDAFPVASPSIANGVVRAAATGVPVVGGLLNKAEAGTNAVLSYALNPLFDKKDQLTGSLSDRYAQSLADQEGMDKQFATQHPIVDTAAKIAGGTAALAPVAATATGARALGLVGDTLAGRTAASAVSGGALGAADAATRGENPLAGGVSGALTGAAGPVAGQAIGKAVEGVRNLVTPAPEAIPSTEAIKNAATAGYDAIRNMNVKIRPEAINDLAASTKQSLMDSGLRYYLAPKTFAALDEMSQNPGPDAFTTFSDIHGIRRVLGKAAQSPDATEKNAASQAISNLDDYLGSIPQEDVISGNANLASQMFNRANANYAAAKRSEMLQGKVAAAELQAASANSGTNIDNALRQRVKDILKSPKLSQGFSQDELLQMQQIVRGTAPANVVRAVGNLLGGGGGLGSLVTAGAGAMAAGPAGLAAPIAGTIVKKIGNRMTEAQLEKLDEMIRARAPFSEQAAAIRNALDAARQQRLATAQNAGALLSRGAMPTLSGASLGNQP